MLRSFELTLELNRPSQPALFDLPVEVAEARLPRIRQAVGQAGLMDG
jgi:hypothetical protein